MVASSSAVGLVLCLRLLRVCMSLCISGEKLCMCLCRQPLGMCLLLDVMIALLKVWIASSMVS